MLDRQSTADGLVRTLHPMPKVGACHYPPDCPRHCHWKQICSPSSLLTSKSLWGHCARVRELFDALHSGSAVSNARGVCWAALHLYNNNTMTWDTAFRRDSAVRLIESYGQTAGSFVAGLPEKSNSQEKGLTFVWVLKVEVRQCLISRHQADLLFGVREESWRSCQCPSARGMIQSRPREQQSEIRKDQPRVSEAIWTAVRKWCSGKRCVGMFGNGVSEQACRVNTEPGSWCACELPQSHRILSRRSSGWNEFILALVEKEGRSRQNRPSDSIFCGKLRIRRLRSYQLIPERQGYYWGDWVKCEPKDDSKMLE
jgi:hypothetical protein